MAEKNWKELLAKYKIYIIAVVVILIAAVVLVQGFGGKAEPDSAPAEGVQEQEAGEAEPEPEPNVLEENSHASIDRLIEKYCEYIASGDVEALAEIVDVLPEEEQVKIRDRAAFIESFDNVTSYTKDGPIEDSYIVFVCYDMKLINIETSAPDIICLYVGPREGDKRLIHYGAIDESMQAYVAELEKDPDVQALYDDVRARYQEAQESDEMLAEFILKISGQVAKEEPAEEPSEETGEENGEEASEENPEPEAEEPEEAEAPEQSAVAVQNRETRVTESVNVRAEATTESERLALAYQGDPITQIESYENGWSKVEYKGLTGYVMTEFLE